MIRAIALSLKLPVPLLTGVRGLIVVGCAAALILADKALPF
jgi:hypothetical protein